MTNIQMTGKSSKYLGVAIFIAISMAVWIGRSDGQQGGSVHLRTCWREPVGAHDTLVLINIHTSPRRNI